jgi:hypothetical protein
LFADNVRKFPKGRKNLFERKLRNSSEEEGELTRSPHRRAVSLLYSARNADVEQLKAQLESHSNAFKEFNDLLKDAANSTLPPSQRIPSLWLLQQFWDPEHERVLANTLAGLIASDTDESVMEACAEVIGYAYNEKTPLQVQERLKELLYGNRAGLVGIVIRAQNLVWTRNKHNKTPDPLYDRRVFYFGEAVRKNWENLSGVNLQDAELPGIHLYEANLRGAPKELCQWNRRNQ